MRRVLHLRQTTRYLGLDRLILQAAVPLRQHSYETAVTILYTNRGIAPEIADSLPAVHPMVAFGAQYGVPVDQVLDRSKWPWGTARQVASRIRADRFDLVHTHGFKENVVGFFAARSAGVPVVSTAHGFSQAFRRLRLYRRLDLLLLRAFPRVIAMSADIRHELIAAGLDPHAVRTIHGAIDGATFAAQSEPDSDAVRRELQIAPGCPVVSLVARLSSEKGHVFFIRGARRLLDEVPNARFLLIGEGPLRPQIEQAATDLALNGAVRFLGFRSDVAKLMASSDLVVLPSLKEAFGTVLLEAGALGKPVIATRVGGIQEIVRHGETGLLVPPADPDALAQAMLRLILNADEARAMGERGREFVAREFSLERMARRTGTVYDDLFETQETKRDA